MDLILVAVAFAAVLAIGVGSNLFLYRALKSNGEVMTQMVKSMDKSTAMIRASDPWQYQTIRSLDEPLAYPDSYDQSTEAKYVREQEEELNANEREALTDIFGG